MILQSKRVWVLNQWMEAQIEVDFGELRVVPGFIDVHTHGAYGFDTNDAEEEGLRNWVQNIVGEGVTGFLPTTITQSEEVLYWAYIWKGLISVRSIRERSRKSSV